jgi:hypothetical protein
VAERTACTAPGKQAKGKQPAVPSNPLATVEGMAAAEAMFGVEEFLMEYEEEELRELAAEQGLGAALTAAEAETLTAAACELYIRMFT